VSSLPEQNPSTARLKLKSPACQPLAKRRSSKPDSAASHQAIVSSARRGYRGIVGGMYVTKLLLDDPSRDPDRWGRHRPARRGSWPHPPSSTRSPPNNSSLRSHGAVALPATRLRGLSFDPLRTAGNSRLGEANDVEGSAKIMTSASGLGRCVTGSGLASALR
jgi:hypothetical protein